MDRKRKKQETNLIEENKELKQLAKKKDEGSTKKNRGKQSSQKRLQRASGCKH